MRDITTKERKGNFPNEEKYQKTRNRFEQQYGGIWMHEESPPCSISVAVFFQAAKITGRKSPIARTRGIRLLTSRINSRVEAASAIPTDVRLLRG